MNPDTLSISDTVIAKIVVFSNDTLKIINVEKVETDLLNRFFENPLSFAAILISLAALFVTIYFSYKIHRHHVLSIRPQFRTHLNKTLEKGLILTLTNCGLGPANMFEVKFSYKDKVDRTIYDLLKKISQIENKDDSGNELKLLVGKKTIIHEISFFSMNNPTWISEKESIELFRAKIRTNDIEILKFTASIVDDIITTIKYKDLYGKKKIWSDIKR